MSDPVILETGHVYDRRPIEQWLLVHGTCPIARRKIVRKDLIPLYSLRSEIQEWAGANGVPLQAPQVGPHVFVMVYCF